jgi:hypothetical protein
MKYYNYHLVKTDNMVKGKLTTEVLCIEWLVVVKWNKQTFNDFEVAPSLGVEMMKA